APLADAVRLVIRERLTGAKPPPSAASMVALWREFIEEKAGVGLDRLIRAQGDQTTFAKLARSIIAELGMGEELGDERQGEESQEDDEGDKQDKAGEDESEGQQTEDDSEPQPSEMMDSEAADGEDDSREMESPDEESLLQSEDEGEGERPL